MSLGFFDHFCSGDKGTRCLVHVYLGSISDIYQRWIRTHRDRYTVEELAHMAAKLVLGGLLAVS